MVGSVRLSVLIVSTDNSLYVGEVQEPEEHQSPHSQKPPRIGKIDRTKWSRPANVILAPGPDRLVHATTRCKAMKPLALLVPLLLLVGFLPASADDKDKGAPPDKPAPKLPLGRETTVVNGPFDKQGYIDYEGALNAQMSKDVTPEKNAVAKLVLALGPNPNGAEVPAAYFQWLDIPVPPRDGNYFIGSGTFAREVLRLNDEQVEALFEFENRPAKRVWAPLDCPPLAEWLKVNDKALALVHEAVTRPVYFNPLASRRRPGDPSTLIAVPLPTVQLCREMGVALAARATLRLGEKKYDDAWQDVLACHRLGRLLTQGPVPIETIVGYAICQFASDAALTYLERAELSSEQALKRWKDLHSLPSLKLPAHQVQLGERMMALDTLQLVHRGGPSGLNLAFDVDRDPTPEERKALDKLDWGVAMQATNKWLDRFEAAVQIKDRGAREKALDAFDKELKDTREAIGAPGEFSLIQLLRLAATKGAGEVVGKKTGDIIAALELPTVRTVLRSHDRITQVERNLMVAFALAAYTADHNRYPAKLEDLAPGYLAAVPADLFTGKALIYKPQEKGYLFYSVGPNGKDDGGQFSDDTPSGDDSGVRIPRPPFKKK